MTPEQDKHWANHYEPLHDAQTSPHRGVTGFALLAAVVIIAVVAALYVHFTGARLA